MKQNPVTRRGSLLTLLAVLVAMQRPGAIPGRPGTDRSRRHETPSLLRPRLSVRSTVSDSSGLDAFPHAGRKLKLYAPTGTCKCSGGRAVRGVPSRNGVRSGEVELLSLWSVGLYRVVDAEHDDAHGVDDGGKAS
jgi:hypothetical protein